MQYTRTQIGKIAQVTLRTLRFYEQIGLLKPALSKSNGQAVYGEHELFLLHQILLLKKMGFELKEIRKILPKTMEEQQSSLEVHKKALLQEIQQLKALVKSIEVTQTYLEQGAPMSTENIQKNFEAVQQWKNFQKLIKENTKPVSVFMPGIQENFLSISPEEFAKRTIVIEKLTRQVRLLVENIQTVSQDELTTFFSTFLEERKCFCRTQFLTMLRLYLDFDQSNNERFLAKATEFIQTKLPEEKNPTLEEISSISYWEQLKEEHRKNFASYSSEKQKGVSSFLEIPTEALLADAKETFTFMEGLKNLSLEDPNFSNAAAVWLRQYLSYINKGLRTFTKSEEFLPLLKQHLLLHGRPELFATLEPFVPLLFA